MRHRARAVLAKWVAPLWPVTLVGLIVGALIGTFAFASTADHTASTVIRVDQPIDANQIMTGTQPFPDAAPDYLSGEIVYLNSPGFLEAVGRRLDQAPGGGSPRSGPPALTAAQSGKSNLVTIEATADGLDAAKRIADAAVATYTDHIKEQTSGRYQAALDAVNAVIPRLEAALSLVDPPPDRPTDELVALYLQRTSLEVQMARAPGVQVVEPTMEAVSAGTLPASLLGTIGGGLLGAIVALGGAITWRSRSGTITSPDQIDGGAPALLPVIRLGGRHVDAATARAIYAQLPPGVGDNVLVIGASPRSGSATAARYLGFAAAEHGLVAAVDLVAGTDGRGTDATARHRQSAQEAFATPAGPVLTETLVTIVDGGTLESSPGLIDAADDASLIIVVVRTGFDTKRAVAATTQATSARAVPVAVVCTRAPFLRMRR